MAATTWTSEQMKQIEAMLARDAEHRKEQARKPSRKQLCRICGKEIDPDGLYTISDGCCDACINGDWEDGEQ